MNPSIFRSLKPGFRWVIPRRSHFSWDFRGSVQMAMAQRRVLHAPAGQWRPYRSIPKPTGFSEKNWDLRLKHGKKWDRMEISWDKTNINHKMVLGLWKCGACQMAISMGAQKPSENVIWMGTWWLRINNLDDQHRSCILRTIWLSSQSCKDSWCGFARFWSSMNEYLWMAIDGCERLLLAFKNQLIIA